MRAALIVSVLAGCYQPAAIAPCAVRCDVTSECPGDLPCTDHVCAEPGTCSGGSTDGGVDAPADGPDIDAPQGCYGVNDLVFCPGALMGTTTLSGIVDTNADGICTMHLSSSAFPTACVITGSTVTLVNVTARGQQPLVVIANHVSIPSASIVDVSARKAVAGPGQRPCMPGNGLNGGVTGGGGGGGTAISTLAGGPGGSSNGAGGVGGFAPSPGYGGCAGGIGDGSSANSGQGGGGGGVLVVIGVQDVAIAGTVEACGGGGGAAFGGGGGGGSGGSIVVISPILTGSGAKLFAVGGGGAGGSSAEIQGDGAECDNATGMANGGPGGVGNVGPPVSGGNGGAGYDGGYGRAGNSGIGGGGGGGGAGTIELHVASHQEGPLVSLPPASP